MGRCKALKEFSNLKDLGFKIFDIVSDGNCLFRSFADQLWADQERYPELRANIVSYMRDHPDDFMIFMSTNGGNREVTPRSTRTKSKGPLNFEGASIDESVKAFKAHLQKMFKNHEWASEQEILACAQLFNISVVVHQKDMTPRPYNEGPTKTIHIAFHSHRHYSSIRPIKDSDFTGILSQDEENDGAFLRFNSTTSTCSPGKSTLASSSIKLSSSPKRRANSPSASHEPFSDLKSPPSKAAKRKTPHDDKNDNDNKRESKKKKVDPVQNKRQFSKPTLTIASDKPRKTCNFDTENEDDGEDLNLERRCTKPVEDKQEEGKHAKNSKATTWGEKSTSAPASTSLPPLLTPPLTPPLSLSKTRSKKRGINAFDSEDEEDDWSTPRLPN